MTHSEAANIKILATYLDHDWLASAPRKALLALVEAAQLVEFDSDPAPRGPVHEPGDVVVTLDLGPAILDPSGQLVR